MGLPCEYQWSFMAVNQPRAFELELWLQVCFCITIRRHPRKNRTPKPKQLICFLWSCRLLLWSFCNCAFIYFVSARDLRIALEASQSVLILIKILFYIGSIYQFDGNMATLNCGLINRKPAAFIQRVDLIGLGWYINCWR